MTLFDRMLDVGVLATLFGLMLSLVFIFVMHILIPRDVLKAYFKEPYFNVGEIAMLPVFLLVT